MPVDLIDPNETLNYTFNWADALGSATISSSTWVITPTGPTLSNSANTSTTATIYVSGCTQGKIYSLSNRITTNGGVIEEKTITLRCENDT